MLTSILSERLVPAVEPAVVPLPPASPDAIVIRGVTLPLESLVNKKFFEPEERKRLRAELLAARPFGHVVIDNLFNPALLKLVHEEFDLLDGGGWLNVKSKYEAFRRSVIRAKLGPASQLYMDIVHTGWFTEWVSSFTAVPYLLPDPQFHGGGLHESRTGASFAIHRDFSRHTESGLRNEMVMITYLNKDWNPAWGGALELWDKKKQGCVTQVVPEFGRTIFMLHGPVSYHGHPKPLEAPPDKPRRSIAAYYYTSPDAGKPSRDMLNTVFLNRRPVDKVLAVARVLTPPVVWSTAKKVLGR